MRIHLLEYLSDFIEDLEGDQRSRKGIPLVQASRDDLRLSPLSQRRGGRGVNAG